MSYILQHPDFGLGNFINLTPAIRWLAEREGRRIPVFFTKDYVRQCFLDCPFLEILDEQPEGGPLFGSNLVNPNNDKPDYQFVFEFVTGERWSEKWHTYVDDLYLDADFLHEKMGGFTVVINGAGNEEADYVWRKDPGEDIFSACLENSTQIVFVGSDEDARRNDFLVHAADFVEVGNIRKCLSLIKAAENVISNDTGLAHAAGAMNKNLTVLVKVSPRERIKNPGKNTQYVYLDKQQ